MGTSPVLSVGVSTSLNRVELGKKFQSLKRSNAREPNDYFQLLKDQFELRTDLRDNKSKATQLAQKKQRMTQKISSINQLINKLNYARINLRIKATQYNIELSMLRQEPQIGNNLDISG